MKKTPDLNVERAKLTDFLPDDKNANRGSVRGTAMIEDSLSDYGAGRSLLADKHGKLIAGNKTQQAAIDKGLVEAIVVHTTGNEVVIVQRDDIDLDSPKGRELAIADNRTNEVSLGWDGDVLAELAKNEVDLGRFFSEGELAAILDKGDYDPMQEWVGMPEFEQQAQKEFKTIIMHFENEADLKKFAELIQQTVTVKTPYLWFPAKPDRDNKQYKAVG